ncbi:hypothetical protein RN001_004948 [Aquatica leii]|uniref:MADF domain-containing protein n=1 Tax=Aquatica leii TaxID=1421715 RepID=A0AAN7PZ39_9COLE|nr:hypothetical protein RN001_004948 [Aquatica leii]
MNDSKLFELVRQHPILFNVKHHQYKDANVRDNIWIEIAASLKQQVGDCKHRWKNIRDTFMRHKKASKLPTGSARSKKLENGLIYNDLMIIISVLTFLCCICDLFFAYIRLLRNTLAVITQIEKNHNWLSVTNSLKMLKKKY